MFKLIFTIDFKTIPFLGIFLLFISCDGILKDNSDSAPIASVGEDYLYKEDIKPFLRDGITKEDSISFVTNFINNWASKKLLLSKAKLNLPKEQVEYFDNLVANYREDLYTQAYKDALVQQSQDTLVSKQQMEVFYEQEKMNFRLKERLVRFRFIEIPKGFLNKTTVKRKLQNFKKNDQIYLDSISIQFKKFNFNDSIWVPASRVFKEIPPLNVDNQKRYLKKSQFFELKDGLGVYLAQVNEVLQVNDIAPLSYIEPTIKQVLLNRRKIDYIRKLEAEVIDEAIKDKEFQVYAKED